MDGLSIPLDFPRATTPGDDYYANRSILNEHANRFVSEHNPANLRLTKPNVVRIEHLSHELSTSDRLRSANTDEYVRERIGYLWWRNEQFVKMPYGTPATQEAWRAERDDLKDLLMDFCDVCAGSGLSIRIIRKHPHNDWRTWLREGIRFSVNKDFQPRLIEGAGTVTPEVRYANLENFNHALDHFGEGNPDDDFLAPRPEVEDQPASTVLPPLDGASPTGRNNTMERQLYAVQWREKYLSASILGGTIHDLWRKWCWFNVAFLNNEQHYAFLRASNMQRRNLSIDPEDLLPDGVTFPPEYISISRALLHVNPWDLPAAAYGNEQLNGISIDSYPNGLVYSCAVGLTSLRDTVVIRRRAAWVDQVLGDTTTGLPTV